jgi:hypothetical protein
MVAVKKSLIWMMIPLAITVFFSSVPVEAKYGGGSGTADDPYQIATTADLIALGETPEDYNKHFILTANIDLTGHVFDKAVIAQDGNSFTGVFDGNGHKIAHLTISKGGSFLGLFGQLGSGAEVKNVGVVDASIAVSGWGANVGGLVGLNYYGSVLACYSTGAVSGGQSVGGLVGGNTGTITSCYSTATVSGGEQAGGLVGGTFAGIISQCYSAGRVTGTSSVGGLLGYNGGTVTLCFWDTQTSRQTISAGGTGKTTAEMHRAATFAGWDFQTTWKIQEGMGYPKLKWEPNPNAIVTTLEKVSGDNQLAMVGSKLAISLTVCLKDQYGERMADVQVAFTFVAGDGTLEPAVAVTNASGIASTTVTLGSTVGSVKVRATVGSLSVEFSMEATAAPTPTALEKVSGDNQQAIAGSRLSSPLTVRVKSQYGQTMAGVQVAFTFVAGSGTLEPAVAVTNASGIASTTVTLGPTAGSAKVRATVDGMSVEFDLEGRLLPVATTIEKDSGDNQHGPVGTRLPFPLTVRVKDQYGEDMAGVQVAFAFMAGDGTLEPPVAVTNTNGLALTSVTLGSTAGSFKVGATVGSLSVEFSMEATFYAGGTGEPDDPYLIWTPEQMNDIGANIDDWDKHFILMADIDMSGFDGKDGRPAYNLIGPDTDPSTWYYDQYAIPFTGTFNGNGHTISNLTIAGRDHIGLFCYLDPSAEVRDLGVVDVNITGMGRAVGGLAGYTRGALVTRCFSTGTISSTGTSVGGLIGYNRGTVTHCFSEAKIHGTSYSVGGLVGESWGTVTGCYSTGAISGTGMWVGGLVGSNYSSVTQCYSTGQVSGFQDVGGLVGISGGIGSGVTDSFWDMQTSGQSTSVGGTGKTTAEMRTAVTFLEAGWDFADEAVNGTEDIWRILEGQDYPRLWWEAPRAKYSGGSGDPNDPYQIATAEDLMRLGECPEDYDKHFILIDDIDLSPNLTGRKVFDKAVIAPDTSNWDPFYQGIPFSGVFDGDNHIIWSLNINGKDYLGLFGRLGDASSQVRNVRLVNANVIGSGQCLGILVGDSHYGTVANCSSHGEVSGNFYIGGLVGYNVGTVTCCSAEVKVSGIRWSIGGLVGYNGAYVQQSYSTGNVTGNIWTGGLVGENGGTLTECYSTGRVWGTSDVGGLVGYDYTWSRADRCFWDTWTSGRTTSAGGTGKNTDEMQIQSTFTDTGWDFVDETANGTEDIWWIDEGWDYPRLWWDMPQIKYGGGIGTGQDPYQIWTSEQMNQIGLNPDDWSKHFKLMVDIDLSGFDGQGRRPAFNVIAPVAGAMGEHLSAIPFTGVFDGNDHVISHLTIGGETYQALFGYLGFNAQVKNLGLVNVDIQATGGYVGAIAGHSLATITQCYCTGRVSGGVRVGGLVGNNAGSITNCFSTVAVNGSMIVGGLVGYNWSGGIVIQCYSTGTVRALYHSVGGLVGVNSDSGVIKWCYSAGAVNGPQDVGGLVGVNYSGPATSCFWDTQTSGRSTSAGGTGKTTAQMRARSTFVSAGWDFMDEIENGTDDIWWILEGQDYPRLWWEASDL